MSVNKVILLGHLGADPEIKFAANGNAVANLRIATSESWRDKTTGEKQERTEWHRVAIFGKLAETAAQYLSKGSQVFLEGSLRTRKYQDQQGTDRYSTEVVLSGPQSVMRMLGGGKQGQGSGSGSKTAQSASEVGAATSDFQSPGGGGFDDDIPFAPYMRGAEWAV